LTFPGGVTRDELARLYPGAHVSEAPPKPVRGQRKDGDALNLRNSLVGDRAQAVQNEQRQEHRVYGDDRSSCRTGSPSKNREADDGDEC
jgi:hypothetical protein